MGLHDRRPKRRERLKRVFRDEHLPTTHDWMRRRSAWRDVLRGEPPAHVLDSIADLLARLGFEPNDEGIPRGPWPQITKTDPLVLLDATGQSIGKRGPGIDETQFSGEWMADVLTAATLVWAGIIELDQEQIQEICPRATWGDVVGLLTFSDLEAFWNRPGVGLTAEGIREKWEGEKYIITGPQVLDSLRKAKGGTSRR